MGDVEAGTLVPVESLVKYRSDFIGILTLSCESRDRTVPDGQFDWGGRLLKSNGGVQRFSQDGWQSSVERKGRRELNCETDKSSRYESRS